MLDFINMTYHQIAQLLSIGEEQTPGQVRSLEDNETVNPKTLRRPFVCLHRDALLLLSPPSQIPSDPILFCTCRRSSCATAAATTAATNATATVHSLM